MTRKRIIVVLLVFALVIVSVVIGYLVTRNTVRVTDAVSGLPIPGAQVVPIYPSFAGAPCLTDRRGVARLGFGLPRGGYGVEVIAAGYFTNSIGTYPTGADHGGWRGDHMDIALQPIIKR